MHYFSVSLLVFRLLHPFCLEANSESFHLFIGRIYDIFFPIMTYLRCSVEQWS